MLPIEIEQYRGRFMPNSLSLFCMNTQQAIIGQLWFIMVENPTIIYIFDSDFV